MFLWTVLISPIFGLGAPFFLVGAIIQLFLSYLLSLAGVYLFAWLADHFAPNFGATRGFLQAFKVGAYGMTAAWVSGIFLLVPIIGVLGLLAGCVYTVYLIHVGLGRLMKPAADKAVLYSVVAIVGTGVIMGIANIIIDRVT